MEMINEMIVAQLGPLGPLMVVGGLGLALVLVTLPFLLAKKQDPLDKLGAYRKAAKAGTPEQQSLRSGNKNDKLIKYSSFLEPQNEEEYSATRLKLMQAGYRSKDAVRTFRLGDWPVNPWCILRNFDQRHRHAQHPGPYPFGSDPWVCGIYGA